VVTIAALSTAAGAEAAYDPVGSGLTKLILAKPFARLLADNGVRIVLKGGAERRGPTIALPASAGEFDPGRKLGAVESEATLVFVRGRRSLPLRDVTFKAKRAPLFAKVGGGQLKVATAERLDARRTGFGMTFRASGLKLTAKFVSRLAKKLRLRGSFESHQLLGIVRCAVVPRTVNLREEGRVQLALNSSFKQKLDNLFVSLNPIAPAELAPGPILSLPIGSDSTLAPDASGGTIKLVGSIELLQLGNAQIFWRELWLQPEARALVAETDAEPSPPRPGRTPQAALFAVSSGIVSSDPSSRTIDQSGQQIALTAAAAASLNEAFAESREIFAAGEAVGALSFRATAE
jgi:hypothetical protein